MKLTTKQVIEILEAAAFRLESQPDRWQRDEYIRGGANPATAQACAVGACAIAAFERGLTERQSGLIPVGVVEDALFDHGVRVGNIIRANDRGGRHDAIGELRRYADRLRAFLIAEEGQS